MADKYRQGKVYCVRNTVDDGIYVGSTTRTLEQRFAEHKKHSQVMSFSIAAKMKELGADNFYIELLEECPCESLQDLRKKEGEWVRAVGTVNQNIPGRTTAEWEETFHDVRMAKFKKYREENRERLRMWRHTPNVCACGGRFTNANKAYHENSGKHQRFLAQQAEQA